MGQEEEEPPVVRLWHLHPMGVIITKEYTAGEVLISICDLQFDEFTDPLPY